jgi:hypothetical protein
MKKLALILALTLPAFANTAPLFAKYESIRQGLLSDSLKDVHAGAKALAAAARTAKQTAIAVKADAVAKSTDLAKARASFAQLSDEMIRIRAKGAPAVYYCSMVKKSWLQPKGTVGNPYEPNMKTCGELKAE